MRSLLFLVVTLVACGGAPEPVNQPSTGGTAILSPTSKPTASGDVSFDVPTIEIKGAVYEPEALGRPGMPLVEAKKRTTLDKQRALVASTKEPVLKQAQAAVLATMLYVESKANKANEKALVTEARQVLRDVSQQVGDKATDETILRQLGSYELLLEDYPAAEKAWQALIEKMAADKDPKVAKEIPYNRAWLAYALLKQFKNADALAAVAGEKLDDKQPELAYITAWAKRRTGDGVGAWQALTVAIKGWTGSREDLEREVYSFAATSNIPVDQAQAPLITVLAKTKLQQFDLLARLGGATGYGAVGRWADGITALDKSLEVAGDAVPVNDRPVIRIAQADYAVCLDNPDAAATYAKQAIDVLPSCDAKCSDKDKANRNNTALRVYNMGRLFHNLYATANDRRYYQPAHDLYAATIPLFDPTTRGDAQKVSEILEKTVKGIKPGTGTHDKGTIGALFVYHNPEIQACYEAALGANPKLGGTIVVNLESDATGIIKGASTEPKAGLADMSAVAGCAAGHIKQWKLPKRGMPGTTRIKLTYSLTVKK